MEKFEQLPETLYDREIANASAFLDFAILVNPIK